MKKEGNNSFGITSVVLGIVGSSLSFLVFPSLLLSTLSLIFGIRQKINSSNTWVIWGIVLGILGIILSVFFYTSYLTIFTQINNQIAQLQASGQLPTYG